MKLSPHFDRHEFECRCGCGFDVCDTELLLVLELIRNHFNLPVTINSAARCLNYNRSIDSKDSSRHTIGKAADIVIPGVNPAEVHDYVETLMPTRGGLGSYSTFTHVDVSERKRRWRG